MSRLDDLLRQVAAEDTAARGDHMAKGGDGVTCFYAPLPGLLVYLRGRWRNRRVRRRNRRVRRRKSRS